MNASLKMRYSAITAFPEMFSAIKNEGIIARALTNGLLSIDTVFLRDFTTDVRKTIDDHPIGGGDGMVIKPDIAAAAIRSVQTEDSFIINLSPSGKVFSRDIAHKLASKKHLILLCGRYAGFDERTISTFADLNLSLGDFVISGGELAAMCVIDSVSRFIPGVLGNTTSAFADSFEDGLLEAPVYTKPLDFESKQVPQVLTSGDHKKIEHFYRKNQLKITAINRPDLILLAWDNLSSSEKAMVEKIWRSSI